MTPLTPIRAAVDAMTPGPWRAVSVGNKDEREAVKLLTQVGGCHRLEGFVTEADVGGTNPSADCRGIVLLRNLAHLLLDVADCAATYREIMRSIEATMDTAAPSETIALAERGVAADTALGVALAALRSAVSA